MTPVQTETSASVINLRPQRLEPVKPPKKWQRVWVNKKLLVVAIAIEIIIVGAVLFASWQFAERYSGDDRMQWWMAIICGISYAAIELARVPLAITAATHRRRMVRWLSVFVLMFAVIVTTKSLSQIGEQMFSQRLIEVNKAGTAMEIAEADNQGAIENDANKRDRIEALDAEIEKLLGQLKEFGKPPEPKRICSTTVGTRSSPRLGLASPSSSNCWTPALAATPWMARPKLPAGSAIRPPPTSQPPRAPTTSRSWTANCTRLPECCS